MHWSIQNFPQAHITSHLIGPWAWDAGGFERRALGIHRAEAAAEGCRQALYHIEALGAQVVCLAYVVCHIVELFFAVFIEVDKFPIALAYGACGANAGAAVIPYIRAIPYQRAALGGLAAQ